MDNNINLYFQPDLNQKLEILSDAAKYDVACTSSGSDRRGQKGMLGNSCAAGICHAFASDGRCISLLKILMTNHCIYDCKYCQNRHSNDIARATFTPDEICTLTVEFYKRNYIEGLFLSSGILKNPDYTMEKMIEALRLLRTTYHFNGYIHIKAIPGASRELLYSAGLLADRMSINMELPTQNSLSLLAPNKTMTGILRPMSQISDTIAANRLSIGKNMRMDRATINRHLSNSIFGENTSVMPLELDGYNRTSQTPPSVSSSVTSPITTATMVDGPALQSVHSSHSYSTLSQTTSQQAFQYPADPRDTKLKRSFAPAGQSTQMIIGATKETDYELLRTTQSLYQGFDLKRVFFSGYIPLNEDPVLPDLDTPVPRLREHRLYQADWLLRFYGFQAEELLSPSRPFFDQQLDPKCNWALQHLEQFPVEINTATHDQLLRVPGIGPTGVKKIIKARRYGSVNFEMLKRMHIALNRARYFITCNGQMYARTPIEEGFIKNCLLDLDRPEIMQWGETQMVYQQMSLFG